MDGDDYKETKKTVEKLNPKKLQLKFPYIGKTFEIFGGTLCEQKTFAEVLEIIKTEAPFIIASTEWKGK
jgi:hypothetical protein